MKLPVAVMILLLATLKAGAASWFASPAGVSTANGSIAFPWDLQTALSQPAQLQAGDTLFLRGGIYTGNYTSGLTGTPGNYIVVIAYNGERATLADNRQYASGATLQVNGAWTIYQDIEITNTTASRGSTSSSSFRPMGVQAQGAHCKFIHIVVHDTGHGFGFWKEAVDAEIYGCLIYNCGTSNSIGNYITHGHGIYTQNDSGLKQIKNNIIFNQFGFGIHLYPNPGHLRGFELKGNVLFHNGILTDTSFRLNNILIETYSPYQASEINICGNYTFDQNTSYPHTSLYDFDVLAGTPSEAYGTLRVDSNYFAGNGRAGLAVFNWDTAIVQYNSTFYRNGTAVAVFPFGSNYEWNSNNYFGTVSASQFVYQANQPAPFSSWVQQSGFDTNSTYVNTLPSGTTVFQLPDAYTAGRSTLVVYNWAQQPAVLVTVQGLNNGDVFEIVDVQNYYGAPVYSGVFNTATPAVLLPLQHTQVAAPLGIPAVPHTSMLFNCFIVRKTLPVAVPGINALQDLHIFPMPATTELKLEFNAVEAAVIYITDASGRNIFSQPIQPGQRSCIVNVAKMDRGVYWLEILSNSGKQTKMLVLQ